MSLLFLTLLEISLALSPLMILVLVAIPFLERRYSPKLQYLLWLVLIVRLVIIWNPSPEEKPLSIPIPQTAIIGELDNPAWLTFTPSENFSAIEDENTNFEPTQQGSSNTFSFLQTITFLWAVGASVFLIYHFLAYVYMCRKIKKQCNNIENEVLSEQFQSIKRELGITKNIGLFQCCSVNTPMLMGFIRPRIIFPTSTSASSQTGMILRHELVHFKRRDLWAKLILLLVRAVYWFNPLIHIMARQTNRAIELCCDADVLRLADDEQRKDYGMAILESLEQKFMPASVIHSGFSDGKRQMKKRFEAIINRSPMSVEEILAAIRASSIYNYDVTVNPEDRVLTLSCNVYSVDGFSDLSNPELASEYRFAVVAKMVSPNEIAKSEAKFELNPTPAPPDTFKDI